MHRNVHWPGMRSGDTGFRPSIPDTIYSSRKTQTRPSTHLSAGVHIEPSRVIYAHYCSDLRMVEGPHPSMSSPAHISSSIPISISYDSYIITSDRICTLPGWDYQERPDSSTNAQICTSGRIYQHPPTRERDNVPFQTLNPPYFH